MKKLTILTMLLFASITSFCQDEVIPAPEFLNTLYVITPQGLKALEKQEASTKVKTTVATFMPLIGLLVGGTASSMVLEGTMSNVRFAATNMRFIYEPSSMVDPELNIKLMPLSSLDYNEQREIQTGYSSIFRSKLNVVSKIPFTYKKYKNKYIIIEVQVLPKGEYGITVGSSAQSNAELKFQLFGID